MYYIFLFQILLFSFKNMCKTLKDLVLTKNDSIDIRDCYVQTGIEGILEGLDKELVGLDSVKRRVREISSVLLFDRIRELQELATLQSSLHMAFTGRPGTGKTTVAGKIALVLRNLGYLTKGHLTNVTREDLVGQYVGHTAPKTREALQKATGGILFIDEAHHLYKPDNERDYGSESVELLLQVMENQRDDLIIIFGGAKDKIETFFNSNPGVSSRIGNHVDFKDYNVPELMDITKFLLHNDSRYQFTPEALQIIEFYVAQLVKFDKVFANARTLKIFLNQLFAYQAIRVERTLAKGGKLDYASLVSIEKEDLDYFTKDDFINIIGSEDVQLYGGSSSSSASRSSVQKSSPASVPAPAPAIKGFQSSTRKLY